MTTYCEVVARWQNEQMASQEAGVKADLVMKILGEVKS